jgi:hypothetical protein
MRAANSLILVATLLGACGNDGTTAAATAPLAPSDLEAEPLSGGVHVMWKDNSDNEENFMVLRMRHGVDSEYMTVATLPFDSVQYHDAPTPPFTAGMTCMYKVMAMNAKGESESNDATVTIP